MYKKQYGVKMNSTIFVTYYFLAFRYFLNFYDLCTSTSAAANTDSLTVL